MSSSVHMNNFSKLLKRISSLIGSSTKPTPATVTASAAAAKTNYISTLKSTLVKFPYTSKPTSPAHVSSLVSDKVVSLLSSCVASDRSSVDSNGAYRIVVRSCNDATLDALGKLGHEEGLIGFNVLLKICIQIASSIDDETVALRQVSNAFRILMSMKEHGFPIEDESYGQVLLYFIDRGMVEQFHRFADVIKNGRASTLATLGYYEMLLYTRVNDKEKVQELCSIFTSGRHETKSLRGTCHETKSLRENYLLALCVSDQKDYLLLLLETVDITQISSLDHLVIIFQSLGRLLLQSHAEKFLLALKGHDVEPEDISGLILCYAKSIPNLTVADVLLRIKNLHRWIAMTPSSTCYAKLVKYSSDLLELHAAFDLVDEMGKAGLSLSMDIVYSLVNAIERSCEFNLVQRLYSLICHHGLKPDVDTYRHLVLLSVKMNDFTGAHGMLNDAKKWNLVQAANMYNTIIAGYLKQGNATGAAMVLRQMKLDGVKPDSMTYSYIIACCSSEEKVTKYYEEVKASKIPLTKHVFIALINAYASCGQFEKSKQVLSDEGIPVKDYDEIKRVLVSALASHGVMADAL